MRIWDINPGYLNDKSLLGEHVEIHGLSSIILNNKRGYSQHPETKRWIKYKWAIQKRHDLIVSEMELRGFNHRSPLSIDHNKGSWPQEYIDSPIDQYDILSKKYANKKQGRIPLPISAQNLWSQHKYSVIARNINEYEQIGREVSTMKPHHSFLELSKRLVNLLRIKPSIGGITNALYHMWGHVKNIKPLNVKIDSLSLDELSTLIRNLAFKNNKKYLLESTALSDLKIWI